MSILVKKISVKNKNYPTLLKQINDYPKQLYVAGSLISKEKYPFAVVGTRKVSTYGKQVVNDLVKPLAKAGLTIVSGLALGVDGLTHKCTIDVNGKTIAVLGSGFNHIYPSVHKKLVQQIIQSNGAVITEYPPDQMPSKFTFPQRNRIIAGLCKGVLVIEAPEKSGAIITAKLALDYNRDVYVVPGSIYSKNSAGTNMLIKIGAKPVTNVQDILQDFNL